MHASQNSAVHQYKIKLFTGLAVLLLTLMGLVASPAGMRHAQAACTTTHADGAYGTVTSSATVPAGTYKVWSRIQIADTTNNGYDLVVGDACTFNKSISTSTTGSWVWVVAPTTVTLAGGTTTVNMYGTKNNVSLDRVLLVADQTCVPTGTGDNCVVSPGDTQSPTVSTTANPSTVTLGSPVTLTATATDNVGVTKVEFYVDNTLVSTDTATPYSYVWSTSGATTGVHSITAKAYDAAGNVGASAATNVTLNAQSTGNGDANGDGRVNQIDYSLWFNQDAKADFNHNGTTDAADLSILLANWTF